MTYAGASRSMMTPMTGLKTCTVRWLWLIVGLLPIGGYGAGFIDSWQEQLQGYGISFDQLTRIQPYVTTTAVNRNSYFNPGNQLAQFPNPMVELDLKPDLSAGYQNLQLMLKPRLQLDWEDVDTNVDHWDNTHSSLYANEWRLRANIQNNWFVSYGREVLLWGPAMFFSPSNPFNVNNNRANPYVEQGGRNYFKINYLPNQNMTLSFISNTGRGRDENTYMTHFHPIDSLKFDYTGASSYWSLLLTHNFDGFNEVGGFLHFTLTDALRIYGEGSYTRGTRALYPLQTTTPPYWAFADDKKNNNSIYGISLVGLAYTLEIGPTLTVEYINNNAGYSDGEARNYYNMAGALAYDYETGAPTAGSAASLLAQARAPRMPLIRRNYLFFQYLQTDVWKQLDITLRYTRNLDDNSNQFIPNFDWAVNDFTHLFALGVFNTGPKLSEARRYFDNQLYLGAIFTF